MSEQEMDLALHRLRQAQNFEEYAESLSTALHMCKTNEEVLMTGKIIEEQKKRLMETSADFKTIMDQRKLKTKMRGERDKALHKARRDKVQLEINKAKSNLKKSGADAVVVASEARNSVLTREAEDWVAQHKMKTITFEEAKEQSEKTLTCPICKGSDRNNTVDGEPFCFKCRHKLVPEDELSNYNREYRRRWKKRRS